MASRVKKSRKSPPIAHATSLDLKGHVIHRFVHGHRVCACGEVTVPRPKDAERRGRPKKQVVNTFIP